MVGSIRYVKQAIVATGWSWLDAEPEIEIIRPDIYAVNEDGDRPEKREYCEAHGIEYVVLRRLCPGQARSGHRHRLQGLMKGAKGPGKVVPSWILLPFILVTLLFPLWGFANDITNPMVKAFSQSGHSRN